MVEDHKKTWNSVSREVLASKPTGFGLQAAVGLFPYVASPFLSESSGGFGVGKYKSRKPRVFMSRANVTGGLDAATIRRVIRRHLSEIQYCYVTVGLPSNPNLNGMVKVSFTISPTGLVGSVQTASSTLGSPRTEACIKSAVRRWRFPKPEGSMPFVTYPFHFRPKGG